METVVKDLIFNFLTNVDEGEGEGTKNLMKLRKDVTSLDELIKYGVEQLKNITDETIIGDIVIMNGYYESWDDIIINTDIWSKTIHNIIPSIQCMNNDLDNTTTVIDQFMETMVQESDKVSMTRDDLIFDEVELQN